METGNLNIIAVLTLALAVLGVLLAAYAHLRLRSLEQLRRRFFESPSGADLEGALRQIGDEVVNLNGKHADVVRDLDDISRHLAEAVQKVGLVRFNPFGDQGGSFSFSLALLNSSDSGVVLTSMHGRDQNRTYTKRVTAGKSEIPLTEEEQGAVTHAQQQHRSQVSR